MNKTIISIIVVAVIIVIAVIVTSKPKSVEVVDTVAPVAVAEVPAGETVVVDPATPPTEAVPAPVATE
jgi:hypothetical protein